MKFHIFSMAITGQVEKWKLFLIIHHSPDGSTAFSQALEMLFFPSETNTGNLL